MQIAELETLLDTGPLAWGWEDQCWTLPRIAAVVRERFDVDYTMPGLDLLLHRLGWSVQVPARAAAERDEEQICVWREETWPTSGRQRRRGSGGRRPAPEDDPVKGSWFGCSPGVGCRLAAGGWTPTGKPVVIAGRQMQGAGPVAAEARVTRPSRHRRRATCASWFEGSPTWRTTPATASTVTDTAGPRR
jgi:Winged helix-turn helix